MKVASFNTDPLAGAASLLADINATVGMTNQSMAEIERSLLSAASAFSSFGAGIVSMTAELTTFGSVIADLNGRIQQMGGAAQETGATRAEIVSTAASAKALADSLLDTDDAGKKNIRAMTAITAAMTQMGAGQTTALAATRALSTGLSLLGGPIGLLNLAITVGITAWATWGKTAETEASKLVNMKGSVKELADEYAKLNRLQIEQGASEARLQVGQAVKKQTAAVDDLLHTAAGPKGDASTLKNLAKLKNQIGDIDSFSMTNQQYGNKLYQLVDDYIKTVPGAEAYRKELESALGVVVTTTAELERVNNSLAGFAEARRRASDPTYKSSNSSSNVHGQPATSGAGSPKTTAPPIDYSAQMRSIGSVAKAESDAIAELARTNESLYAMGAKSATEYYDAKSSLATQAAQVQISAAQKELQVFQDLIASGKGTSLERKKWADEEELRAQAVGQAQQNLLKAQQRVEAERAEYATKQALERAGQAEQSAAAAESQAKALSDQVEQYGKTKSAIAELVAARAQDDVAMAESRLELAQARGERAESIKAIEKEVAALKNRAKALGQVVESTKQLEQRDNKAEDEKRLAGLAAEAKKKNEEVATSLTDALMRGFESGKGFGKDFVNTLKSMFSKLVLRPILEPIAQGAAGVVTSLLGLVVPGAAGSSGSSSGGGLFDNAGVIGKLFGGGSTTSFGDNVAGLLSKWTASSVGTDGIMGSVANAIATNSKAIAGFANTAASVLSYGAAAMAALDGKFGTAIGTALGTAIGASFGFGPLGAFVGSKIGGMIDGMLGGETRAGGTYRMDEMGKVQFIHGPSGGQAGAGDGVKSAMEATVTTINKTLAAIGSSFTVEAFHGAFEQSEKGRGGVMSGGQLSSGATFGESGLGSNYAGTYYERSSTQSPDIKTALANFNTDLKQVTIQALQAAIDIPEAVKAMVQGVDAEALSDEAVTALLTTINTQISEVQKFRSAIMALPFENMRNLSYDAVASLIKLSGGIEQLSSNMTTYMEKFYTDDERAAISLNQMTVQMAMLGVQLPKTREEYRKIIEAQVLTSASGQLVSAAMLEMAGQFDEWVTYSETVSKQQEEKSTVEIESHKQVIATMKSAYSEYLTSLENDVDTARSAVETAYNNESSALKATISATEAFIKSLDDLKSSLLLGDLSTLTPEQKYVQAKSSLDALIGRAESGDAEARAEARAEVPQAIQQFLTLSRSYNASTEAYQRDFAQYLGAAERMRSTATSQLDIQQTQLERLNAMVSGILNVNKSVQSLGDALTEFAKAVAKKDGTSLIAPTAPTGLTPLEQAINAVYLANDGRNADLGGLGFWRDAILNGADQNKILEQIARDLKNNRASSASTGTTVASASRSFASQSEPVQINTFASVATYDTAQFSRSVQTSANSNADVVTELRATRDELAEQRRENGQLMSTLITLTSAASQQASREMSEQTTALRNRNSTLVPA